MADTKIIEASCLCGSSAHQLVLPSSAFPLPTTLCHCDSCRHMTGTLSFACTRLPKTYQPDDQFVKRLTAFKFSQKIMQYNCSTCGAFVLSSSKLLREEGEEQKLHWDVMTGTLKQLDGDVFLRGHIYVKDTKDGGFADFLPTWNAAHLPRWSLYDDRDDEQPLGWREVPTNASTYDDKLYAHCKCGGVEFWIRRPARASNNGAPRPVPSTAGEMCSPDLAAWVRNDSGRFLACNCACNSCRLATGMEVTQWAFVNTGDIWLDEACTKPYSLDIGSSKRYKSSPGATRTFCSICGAIVFFLGSDREGVIDVGVGLFDAPEGARAEAWLEWRLERLGFSEDTVGRSQSLARAIEDGFTQYRGRQAKST